MAQFMLILHYEPKGVPRDISPAQMQSVIAEYGAWASKMATAGRLKGGQKLKDEGGKQVSMASGKMRVVDGPYAEAREVISGYFVIEADSYAHAVELVQDHPHLKYSRKIDIREVDVM
jgi:hypothetical protein